ncbi:MAG: malectin domain-containing carbohydrate-binding protein, partial [Phototrophicaceae bacterium]
MTISAKVHLRFIALLSILIVLFGVQSNLQTVEAQQINFSASGLNGESNNNPTSLQFGPDGRLYVSQQNGLIYAYNVTRNAVDDYQVTATETINQIANIINHNDDGSATSQGSRQVTGILLSGTGTNPILYVSSSDPRIGAGGGGNDKGLDTNSGMISRLECVGGITGQAGSLTCSQWEKVDLVRGLPRSEENHATNGMEIDEATNTLYLAVGGHTNAGAPSNNFAFTVEYTYSSTIIAVDLDMIATMPVLTDPNNGSLYIYDLPTLDDPTRDNVFPDGTDASEDPRDANYSPLDVGDPFGGNDGLNMAKIDLTGPVSIHAVGFRNLYDIVLTTDGRMYGVDNGANGGWGGHPDGEADYDAEYSNNPQCTNNYLNGEPGSNGDGQGGDDQVNNKNGLHYIQPLQSGQFNYVAGQDYYYGGHPHVILANPGTPMNLAIDTFPYNPQGGGIYTYSQEDGNGGPDLIDDHSDPNPNDGNNVSIWRNQILDPSASNFAYESLPVDWPPVPVGSEFIAGCDFRNSGQDDNSLVNFGPSTNGITEYTASNFNGAMQGYLLMAAYNGNIYQVELSADGTQALNCPIPQQNGTSTVSNCTDSFASGFGSSPLDVTAQGDNDPFGGTVWAVTYGANFITVFEPADYDGNDPILCEGTYSLSLDEDGDLYSNADEIDAGSNPCSGASQPIDFDGSLQAGPGNNTYKLSNFNDPDDDDDTILDVDDAFNFDASNGTSAISQLPLRLEFFNSTSYGYGDLGLTGMMTNGEDDYFDLIDDNGDELVFGGTAGIYTDPSVSDGDAYLAVNTQQNGFQFGVDVDANTGPFTVESQINGPFFGNDPTPDNFASQGIYIGTGDQDNYVKFVLTGNVTGQPAGFQIFQESAGISAGGASNDQKIPVANILDATGIQMFLSVDPVAGTVQASYAINGGVRTNVGVPVTIAGNTLNAVRGTYTVDSQPSALAVGMIATSTNVAAEFAANWDYFDVSQNPSETTAIVSVNTNGINGSTFGNGSFNIENTSTNGATITNVVINLAGNGDVLLPEVVFDPNGTAGDGTAKDLTFNNGSDGGTGYINHTFADAYEGGFYTLDIDFNDFDPTEIAIFGLDIDPVSIKDGDSPGPYQSGSVSGLELTGATVTVTFSTGEVWIVDLFRTVGSDSASTAIVRNALPLPVTLELVGSVDGDTVFTADHTIRLTGEVGSEVRLLHVESGLFVADLTGLYEGVGYNIDPFEVNSVITINEYTDFIGNSFDANIDVTLVRTDVNGSTDDVDQTGYNTFVAVVVDNDGATSPVSNIVTVQYDPTAAPSTIYRVNTSATTILATDGGLDWVATGAAGAQTGNGFSVNTGSISTQNTAGRDASVPDYAPQSLFTQERYDAPAEPEMAWAFDVTPGTYVVNLFMGNGFAGTSEIGERVFDISIEGQLVQNDLDLVSQFGHQVGGMLSYTVTVSDNSLDILFEHVTENPLINAIEILTYNSNTGGEIPIALDPITNQTSNEGDDIGNTALFVVASGGDGNLSYVATGLPAGIQLEPTNGQFFGTVVEDASLNSPYTVTITVDDSDGGSDDAVTTSFTWVVLDDIVLPTDEPLICVNIGGLAGTAFGRNFVADNGGGTTSTFLVGGAKYGSIADDVLVNIVTLDGTDLTGFEEDLYQTERYGGDIEAGNQTVMTLILGDGNLVSVIPSGSLPSGDYIVDLYFAEIFQNVQAGGTPGGVGDRVFDIVLEGTLIRDDFDLFAIPEPDAPLTAIVVTEAVTITDGALTVDFTASADNAKISAICITPAESEAPIISPIADVESGVAGLYDTGRFLVQATDPQEDAITFSALGLPAGLDINPSTGEIFGTIEASALTGGTNSDGIHEVTITATDDSAELNSSELTFNFSVVTRTISIDNLIDGATVSSSGFAVNWTSTGGAVDVFEHIHVLLLGPSDNPIYIDDGFTRYGSQPLNGSASFPSDVSGPYPTLPEGDYILELRWAYPSHDEMDLTVALPTSINITIDDAANLPPIVTNPGDQTNVEGETVSLPIFATAPELGQTLTYGAQGLPDGLTINPVTGLISGVLPTATPNDNVGAFI